MNKSTLVFNCSKINDLDKMYSIGVFLYNAEEGIIKEFESAYINRYSYDETSHIDWLTSLWVELETLFSQSDNYCCLQASSHHATLVKSLNKIGVDLPKMDFLNLPSLLNRRLPGESHMRVDLVKKFNILPFGSLNRDLNDAFFTIKILENLLSMGSPSTVSEVIKQIETERELSDGNFWRQRSSSSVDIGSITSLEKYNGEYFLEKTFLVTGIFSNFPDRKILEGLLQELGGLKISGVSRKLNILIVGSDAGPSKIMKANELIKSGIDIKVIDEKALMSYLLK